MICGAAGCLLWPVTAGGVLAEADTVARLEGLLARALEANRQLTALVERQRVELVVRDVELERVNAELAVLVERQRVELVVRDAELERVNAELAVLKRMLFGRSSERARPAAADSGADSGITRTCRGWSSCGTSPAAGTAARSARRRFTGWGIMSARCWIGW